MQSERSNHYRQEPLMFPGHSRQVYDVGDGATTVYASPGYMLFIERMWHGDYQQVPVEIGDDDTIAYSDGRVFSGLEVKLIAENERLRDTLRRITGCGDDAALMRKLATDALALSREQNT